MPTVAEIKRSKIIAEYRRGDQDTGSPEVQVAILTDRVTELTGHLRINRHDHASRRGLLMMVGRRNRLLRYLSRTKPDSYRNLIKRLGLRK